jgi:hypothetical protein
MLATWFAKYLPRTLYIIELQIVALELKITLQPQVNGKITPFHVDTCLKQALKSTSNQGF